LLDWKDALEQDMALIKLGQRSAFEALYVKTSPKLYGLLMKLVNDPDVAADVLQESYVKIWLNCQQYQSHLGDPWPWLCQLTRHCAFDVLRKQKRDHHLIDAMETIEPDTLESLLVAHKPYLDLGYDLHACLAKVRKEPRQAIVLAYFYGFSHSELASKLQQPLGTLKSWVKRGLKEIETCLND
jgi:RNA polymerase sigma-70 factor, ECF subfamily